MNTISKIMMIVICSAIAIIVVVVFIIGKNDYKDNKSQSNNNSNDTTIDSSYETNNETDNNYNNLFIISDKKVNLNNGIKMPILGLGTWTLTISETEETVYNAIKAGFRLIDTAEYYGNEEGVGKGVKKCIQEGIIKREDIFITSKIMPDAYSNPDFAIEDSLKNLDVDYIDLMLIHQPGNNDENVYKSMEKYYKNGKLKSIGISANSSPLAPQAMTVPKMGLCIGMIPRIRLSVKLYGMSRILPSSLQISTSPLSSVTVSI